MQTLRQCLGCGPAARQWRLITITPELLTTVIVALVTFERDDERTPGIDHRYRILRSARPSVVGLLLCILRYVSNEDKPLHISYTAQPKYNLLTSVV